VLIESFESIIIKHTIMSKEMTAKEYREENYPMSSHEVSIYGDLRAKEAVKEFAEELMKWKFVSNVHHESGEPTFSIRDVNGFATYATISMLVKHLAKQKGVEI
jgi:DNA-binding Lrp family transcriptional regulator